MKQGSFDFPPNGPFSGKPTNHLTVIILTVTPIPNQSTPDFRTFPTYVRLCDYKNPHGFHSPRSSTVTVTCSSSCSCSAKSQRFAFSTALLQAAKDTTVASYGRAGAGAGWRHGKGGKMLGKRGIWAAKMWIEAPKPWGFWARKSQSITPNFAISS